MTGLPSRLREGARQGTATRGHRLEPSGLSRRLAGLAALMALAGCATAPSPVAAPPPSGAPAQVDSPPPGFLYLYGSGEAAALSRQVFHLLADSAIARAKASARTSVVLDQGATLSALRWTDCAGKPPAAVFDADETVLLNLGVEELSARHPGPFDEKQWDRWERTGANAVAAVPGARDAFARMRAAGVTIVINSNRVDVGGSIAALKAAGLGDFVAGDTLYLRDAGGKSGKDARRARIAAHYCVVAMAGDQLGDFSDLFNAIPSVSDRRKAADSGAVAAMWGDGWFVLPNPVYGSGLKGGYDDVFPLNTRWADPGEPKE